MIPELVYWWMLGLVAGISFTFPAYKKGKLTAYRNVRRWMDEAER